MTRIREEEDLLTYLLAYLLNNQFLVDNSSME